MPHDQPAETARSPRQCPQRHGPKTPAGRAKTGQKMRTDMAWQFPSWRTQSTHVEARSNLAALDRDERRALSRHKSAIQLFDAFRVANLTGAQTPDECP